MKRTTMQIMLEVNSEELEKLERFREFSFSHNSAEEFLGFLGDRLRSYKPKHLSVAYVNEENPDDRLYLTELKLAKAALQEGCRYVTNIDYCGPCIAATGLYHLYSLG